MSANPATSSPFPPVCVATVVATEGTSVGVRSAVFGALRAEVATERMPRPGDRAVVLVESSGAAYVVGLLGRAREETERSSAPLAGGELLVEELGDRVRLRLPQGDLELTTDAGHIALRARDGIRIETDAGVAIDAEREVVLQSAGGRSRLSLDGDAAELRAGLLEAKAARLRVMAEEIAAVAVRADAHVERLRQKFDVVETEATRIVQNAKTLFQTVEDLAQMRAGRLRLVAEGSFHALAERAQLTARKVFRVNGERIHLG